MKVRKEIKVDCLRQDEALQLFQENVGQEILLSNPHIGALSRELVKELKGLPLALIATGKAMYPKKDPGERETAIRLLRRSGHDADDPTSVENTIYFKLKHTVPKGTISRLQELQVLDLLSSQVLDTRKLYSIIVPRIGLAG
ncbi:hypothetical protein ACQJBY_004014 [Aegilops geniculata]